MFLLVKLECSNVVLLKQHNHENDESEVLTEDIKNSNKERVYTVERQN
jgi:hypothetical protein